MRTIRTGVRRRVDHDDPPTATDGRAEWARKEEEPVTVASTARIRQALFGQAQQAS
jgi:hypothetical protein